MVGAEERARLVRVVVLDHRGTGVAAVVRASDFRHVAGVGRGGDATLLEMLQRAIDRSVSGSWQSGRLTGQWLLKGLPK